MRLTIESKAIRTAITAVAASLSAVASAEAANTPVGVWLDDKGRGAIEIKQCGATLCGHVVWVKSASDKKGCGRKMIGKVKQMSDSRWDGGWIYSPERRKTYDVELRPLDNGNLQVTGYAGTKLFSRTMVWKPAPADLVRCNETPKVEAKLDTAATATDAVDVTSEPSKTTQLPAATATQSRSRTEPAAPAPAPAPAIDDAKAPATVPARDESADEGAGNDNEDVADAVDNDSEGPPAAREKGLDLGELGLDKYLKRTKGGKCKLDLPWVKVNFKCER